MENKIPMTEEGFRQLQHELKKLKQDERSKVAKELAQAASLGDLSENAEYEAAKERQALLETKIKEISDKLARAQIIKTVNLPKDRVVFGVKVVLEDLNTGKEVSYKIVGEYEADIKKGRISINSPIARALIGKSIDDVVQIKTPSGTKEYQIIDISSD